MRIAWAAVVAGLVGGPAAAEIVEPQLLVNVSSVRRQAYGAVAVNAGGTVTFMPDSEWAPGGTATGQTGIYRSDGLTTSLVGVFGGGGLTQLYHTRFPINDSGLVAIDGGKGDPREPGNPVRHGIWTGTGGGMGGLTLRYHINAADLPSPFTSVRMGGMNNSGEFGFAAWLPDGSQAVYLGNGTTDGSDLTPLVATTNPLFGGSLYQFGATVFDPLDVNDRGDVLFRAALAAGGEGLFLANSAGFAPVADTSAAGGIFAGFATKDLSTSKYVGASVNESGEVAFRTVLSAGGQAVYLYDRDGQLTKIADTQGAYAGFGAVAIHDRGRVVFQAVLDSGTVGIYTGGDPATGKIIATGDVLGGKTITDLVFGDWALTDRDTIAFYAGFNEYVGGKWTQGIYRALAPEFPGDADLDGYVGLSDLVILARHWQANPAGWRNGNFNGDAVVGLEDLIILARNWGRGTPQSPRQVPEPGMLALVLAGWAGLCRRRRSAEAPHAARARRISGRHRPDRSP